ncbi:hypothetical protein MiSe_24850 [Microseira wollei NIES-4236]|uniref:Uncharacterized protein n=1 Tax=Microseira wollei NIES-4236 TaxID=2530354 RepID=A0AAV3X8S3_9CYAN|nr:hypothetical protein MiSe_24850 [Microseira wollei NIES-4236]
MEYVKIGSSNLKIAIGIFKYLSKKVIRSDLRAAGAKFRSSIHKSCATIVFSELPEKARTILEDITNLQDMGEALENIEHPIDPEVEQVFESPLPLDVDEDLRDETRNISSPTPEAV